MFKPHMQYVYKNPLQEPRIIPPTCISKEFVVVIHDDTCLSVIEAVAAVVHVRWHDPRWQHIGQLRSACKDIDTVINKY